MTRAATAAAARAIPISWGEKSSANAATQTDDAHRAVDNDHQTEQLILDRPEDEDNDADDRR